MTACTGRFVRDRDTMLGYPLNCSPPNMEMIAEEVQGMLSYPVNNLGDPFVGGNYGINTFAAERDLIRTMGEFFHLHFPESWGYVTSCGSEGNFRGILLGKQRFPSAKFYCSETAHYSVHKAGRVLGMDTDVIPAYPRGMIKSQYLWNVLENNRPAIVCLTAGTTMTGAVDQVVDVLNLLNYSRVLYHVHVDAALGGLILPFLDSAPLFDFRLDISSLSVSGHKMLGCPIPCGVFLTRRDYVPRPEAEYICSDDTTLFGSRSGLSVYLLWRIWSLLGHNGLKRMVNRCMEVTRYAEGCLQAIAWPYAREPYSTTITIKRPRGEVVWKWQLAVQGDTAHIICMPHVTESMIKLFVDDLSNERKV